MKQKIFLICASVVISLFLVSSMALAATGANIVYEETNLGGGLWQYDYTFYNASGSEYLFAVDLLLDQWATVDWLNIPTGWDSTLSGFTPTVTDFIDTASNDLPYDIAPGSSLGLFSFTLDYQAGSISYDAYFDDGSVTSGVTVTPEPISSILFLSGGATLGIRRYLKRRRHSTSRSMI
ncbi:MAG TPA: hypothetical protein ENG83_04140 [Nitrospirae bacterium]|nr:hypothetical protein [Nitrospirota bacterium]HDZ01466.1 hypothetical protein [Nitrospirota bacterium]